MTPSTPSQPPVVRRRLAIWLGLFLFSVYLLSYRGGFHSVDEVSMFAVTESLVKFGRLNTDQIAWTQWTTSQAEAQGFFGPQGHVYSKKGLALSLAQAPLYWLARHLPGLGMLQTVSLLNAGVTAVTGSLLLMFLWRLGYAPSIAVTVSLMFGLATIAFVYAKYLFSEPLAGCLLLLTTYMLFTYRQEGGLRHVGIAGLAAGLAVLTRANNLFLLPIFGLYLTWVVRPDWSKLPKINGLKKKLSHLISHTGLPLMVFSLSAALSGIILMAYNDARAGDPFQTGYDLTLFTPNVWLGLYKLLFSPLRGFFIYSPLLLLSLPGWWHLRRQQPAEAWLMASCVGITLALFSAWSSGEGLSWGSRFLVPLVPFFALCLAPVIRLMTQRWWLTITVWILGLLSGIIQLLAITINPWVFLNHLQTRFGGEFFLENTAALYNFRYSQIVGQWQFFEATNSDLVWWQPWEFDGLAFGLSLSLVLLTGGLLARTIIQPASRFEGFMLLLMIPLMLGSIYFLLARYAQTDRQFGPPVDPYTQALETAYQQTGPTVPILTVAPYHYHVPMNRFQPAVPLIGLAQQSPPLPATAGPLLRQATTDPEVWLVTVGFPPASPRNATEQWLTFTSYKAHETWFDEVRLVRYSTVEPTLYQALNVTLGEEIWLLDATFRPTGQPSQHLTVKLTWRPIRRPTADYNLFLQLLDSTGHLVAQHDGPPNGGYTNTSTWFVGQTIVSRSAVALPADLPPGNYRLIAGLYQPDTGHRLPTDTGEDFVELGRVIIMEGGQTDSVSYESW